MSDSIQAGMVKSVASYLLSTTQFNPNIPLHYLGLNDWNPVIPVPKVFLWMAGISSFFHIMGQLNSLRKSMVTWLWSFLNGSQYTLEKQDKNVDNSGIKNLNQQTLVKAGCDEAQLNQNAFVVIYGTSNKAGMSFAYYFMQKGFNLILIERDSESIKNLVIKLHQLIPDSKSVIIQVVLNSFDQDSLNKAVGEYITLPVKIFVNCKSSKRT